MPSARLTVDLDALAHNFAAVRVVAGAADVAPVVKADAYGMGVEAFAGRLWAEGARRFYLARLSEGETLRRALPDAQLMIFDGCAAGEGPRLRAARLTPVLNSLPQLEAWAASGGGACGLMIDTGMNRLGLRPEELRAALQGDRLRRLDVETVLSHLACATEGPNAATDAQAAELVAVAAHLPHARVSLSNSAGAFLGLGFGEVRPGVSLHGGGPFARPDPRLRTVATLTAPVLQVRVVPPGERVGYGGTFTATRTMTVAVIAAGYADGFLRSGGAGGYAFCEGALRPLLGRVSMDLIAVDVTDCGSVQPGTEVELFGPNRPLDDVAVAAGTVPYELLSRAGRAERVYLGSRG